MPAQWWAHVLSRCLNPECRERPYFELTWDGNPVAKCRECGRVENLYGPDLEHA